MKTKFKKRIYLGMNEGSQIYLSAPSWDCGWYWGFGYLGNSNCHYHVNGLDKDKNLFDAFKDHFGETLQILDTDLWTVCELFSTFYTLKETAEVLGRGGSHFPSNPIKDIIINKDKTERINNIVLPKLFDSLYEVFGRFERKKELFKEVKHLIDNNSDIPTFMVIDLMFENGLTTDDLKSLNEKFGGVSKQDFTLVHSLYWKRYHTTKKQ